MTDEITGLPEHEEEYTEVYRGVTLNFTKKLIEDLGLMGIDALAEARFSIDKALEQEQAEIAKETDDE